MQARTMLFAEQLMGEGDMVVAYCPELDVSSCGPTFEQLYPGASQELG